jgi:zinc/manganese transport system substrate-binding protein
MVLGWALVGAAVAQAQPLDVVAAENFYGDIAQQLGGSHVQVSSILINPDQDPHLFEASASTARDIAAAKIVIYNGINYDPWMVKLLSASRAPGREIIEVAKLAGRKVGDNPHLWYDTTAIRTLAGALSASLVKLDPDHRAEFDRRLVTFTATFRTVDDKVAELRGKYAGTPVTATEPVFGYMAGSIGLEMRNAAFQLAVMNDTEPSASQIAAFQKDLKTRAVKVLLYNSQARQTLTERLRALATSAGVPIVGVSETQPPGTRFQDWMLAQLGDLERALAGTTP